MVSCFPFSKVLFEGEHKILNLVSIHALAALWKTQEVLAHFPSLIPSYWVMVEVWIGLGRSITKEKWEYPIH